MWSACAGAGGENCARAGTCSRNLGIPAHSPARPPKPGKAGTPQGRKRPLAPDLPEWSPRTRRSRSHPMFRPPTCRPPGSWLKLQCLDPALPTGLVSGDA